VDPKTCIEARSAEVLNDTVLKLRGQDRRVQKAEMARKAYRRRHRRKTHTRTTNKNARGYQNPTYPLEQDPPFIGGALLKIDYGTYASSTPRPKNQARTKEAALFKPILRYDKLYAPRDRPLLHRSDVQVDPSLISVHKESDCEKAHTEQLPWYDWERTSVTPDPQAKQAMKDAAKKMWALCIDFNPIAKYWIGIGA